MTWNARGSGSFSAHDDLSFPIACGIVSKLPGNTSNARGELGDGAAASRFLSDVIETMIRRGQRSRLALSNRAISAYQRFRSSGAAGSERARSSA